VTPSTGGWLNSGTVYTRGHPVIKIMLQKDGDIAGTVWKTEAGGSHVQGQPGLHDENCLKRNKLYMYYLYSYMRTYKERIYCFLKH
jgi:hypothetical protein